MRFLVVVVALLGLAACSQGPGAREATVASVVDPMALQTASGPETDPGYRIGATDKLRVSVFQVPDLSFDEIVVDAAGNLQFPLVGSIRAEGRTPSELSDDLESALGGRYLRNPQVNVTVTEAVSQKVTVDGAVTEPGVYEMRGRTTLLQAVAMAKGPSRVAAPDSVAVFRTVDDRRMVAVFDLAAIRRGQQEDPVLRGDDIVVVDTSRLSSNLQLALQALPSLAVFGYLQ